jgi:hypothetical protein
MKCSTVTISFEDSFPVVGEEREIVTKDKAELKIIIQHVENLRWKVENGRVIGALADVTYTVKQEIRPSSVGKIRLIE